MKIRHYCLIIICIFFFAGCISKRFEHRHQQNKTKERPIAINSALSDYQSYKKVVEFKKIKPGIITSLVNVNAQSFFIKLSLTEKGVQGPIIIKARYFKPKISSRRYQKKNKLIIVLPIYGSKHTYPQKVITKKFMGRHKSDTNVLMIEARNDPFDWKEEMKTEKAFLNKINSSITDVINMTLDVRRWIDWAMTQPDINQNRIGIIGFSIGGIFAANVMTTDPRISTGVLVMSGGSFHQIFCKSMEKELRQVREKALKRFNWTPQMLENKTKKMFAPINPVSYAQNIDPFKIFLVESYYDNYIPKESRNNFWKALGQPEKITLMHGHKVSFLSMTPLNLWRTNDRIDEFFEKKL